jgi:hypothetical protein
MMMLKYLARACLVVFVFAAAACGGGESELRKTKTYIDQGELILNAFFVAEREQIARVGEGVEIDENAMDVSPSERDYLTRYATINRDISVALAKDIRTLEPPEDFEAAHANYLAAIDGYVAYWERKIQEAATVQTPAEFFADRTAENLALRAAHDNVCALAASKDIAC